MYEGDDLTAAMRRFNEALAMLSHAWTLDPANPRLMADLGRVVAREGTSAGTATERERDFALYDQGRYAQSWEKVHRAQELQAVIPQTFLRMLRDKMPEPTRRE